MTNATTKAATAMPNKIWAWAQTSLITRWSNHGAGVGTTEYVRADIVAADIARLRGEYLRALEDVKDLANSPRYAGRGLYALIEDLRAAWEAKP